MYEGAAPPVLRYRIITGAAPGVAAHNAAEGKPAAFERAILAERFQGILGTGWRESAAWRCERTDAQLIELDQNYQRESQYFFNRGAKTVHINHLTICPQAK